MRTRVNDEDVGRRLRALREASGYTLEEVQGFTGIPEPSLSDYELGRDRPPLERLHLLCLLYRTSIDYLASQRETAENHFRAWPEGFQLLARIRRLGEKEKALVCSICRLVLDGRGPQLAEVIAPLLRSADIADGGQPAGDSNP